MIGGAGVKVLAWWCVPSSVFARFVVVIIPDDFMLVSYVNQNIISHRLSDVSMVDAIQDVKEIISFFYAT